MTVLKLIAYSAVPCTSKQAMRHELTIHCLTFPYLTIRGRRFTA